MLRTAPGPESPCNTGFRASKAKEGHFEVMRLSDLRSLFLASGRDVACCCVDLSKPISACRSRIDSQHSCCNVLQRKPKLCTHCNACTRPGGHPTAPCIGQGVTHFVLGQHPQRCSRTPCLYLEMCRLWCSRQPRLCKGRQSSNSYYSCTLRH
jgi:hypothetical protein